MESSIRFTSVRGTRKANFSSTKTLWTLGLIALSSACVMAVFSVTSGANQTDNVVIAQNQEFVTRSIWGNNSEGRSNFKQDLSRNSKAALPTPRAYDRLPQFAYPTLYQIMIHPFYENFTFKGTANITVTIVNDTSILVLNAYKLFNLKASIYGEHNEDNLMITEPRFDVIQINMTKPLNAGSSYVLSMSFEGYITDDLVGIYRSLYTDRNNRTAYMIATQFESTGARRSFPCWDEPLFKAAFEITLIAPANTTALSNMAVSTSYPNPDNSSEVIVRFLTTPKMSTYLIALAIGDMDHVEAYDIYNTLHRVFTPVYRSQEGLYALNVSIRSIEQLTAYFKQLYPLQKLDSLALKDFQAGAMENWGLVTYREARVLVGEGTSLSSKFSTANTICHENSHMWFGDLVTMGWWSDLWLNEGFATWSAYRVEDILFPEYQTWIRFLGGIFRTAINADARESTHRIVVDVPNTDSVDSIFDSISYNKGSSVIRMLEEYVGSRVFRNALQAYMQTYAYKNAYTEDLWAAISKAYGQDIAPMINTWTYQAGFPYVSASFEFNGTTATVQLEQQRFFANGKSDENGTLWQIPVSIISGSSSIASAEKFLMTNRTVTHKIYNIDPNAFIKLNSEKSGFFITKYNEAMLSKLRSAVLNMQLGTLDRLDLEMDLNMLSTAGLEKMSAYLDFLFSYVNETDYTIWNGISNNLFTLNGIMEYMNLDTNLTAYVNKLYSRVLEYVGWDAQPNESETMASLRSVVLQQLGFFGHPEVVEKMKSLFHTALNDPSFQPNLRSTVLIVNVKNGGVNEYNLLKQSYLTATTSEEEVNALVALGYTTDPDCAKDLTAFASLSGQVRIQDVFYPLRALGYSKLGRDTIWSYMKANITELLQKYSLSFFVEDYIARSLNGFASTEMMNEMKTFFQQNGIPTDDLTINNMMEQIQIRSNVVARSREDLSGYLHTIS